MTAAQIFHAAYRSGLSVAQLLADARREAARLAPLNKTDRR